MNRFKKGDKVIYLGSTRDVYVVEKVFFREGYEMLMVLGRNYSSKMFTHYIPSKIPDLSEYE